MNILPLPKYTGIDLTHIPRASTILFYGGNKFTEFFGNKIYRHPYKPPAFHAAFYIEEGLFLNVGKFRTVQELEGEFRSNRRIDIITYLKIDDQTREELNRYAYLNTSKPKFGFEFPDYDVLGYLGFGIRKLASKIPVLKKWAFQSKKKFFCSENVVDIFATQKIEVSLRLDFETAPWDLFDYALAHPERCVINTLWVGKDFKG